MATAPKPTLALWQNKILLYDMDLNFNKSPQILRRIRLRVNDPNGINTPITSLYQARFREGNPSTVGAVYQRDNLTLRQLECCFNVNNERESIRTVYVPYNPDLPEHNLQIKETLELIGDNNLIGIAYFGEDLRIGGSNLTP